MVGDLEEVPSSFRVWCSSLLSPCWLLRPTLQTACPLHRSKVLLRHGCLCSHSDMAAYVPTQTWLPMYTLSTSTEARRPRSWLPDSVLQGQDVVCITLNRYTARMEIERREGGLHTACRGHLLSLVEARCLWHCLVTGSATSAMPSMVPWRADRTNRSSLLYVWTEP